MRPGARENFKHYSQQYLEGYAGCIADLRILLSSDAKYTRAQIVEEMTKLLADYQKFTREF